MGKGRSARAGGPNLSGARDGSTTEGEDRKRFHALRGPPVPGATSHPSNEHHQPRFADRHIGPDADAVATMLEVIGVETLGELAQKALPSGILDALTADGL